MSNNVPNFKFTAHDIAAVYEALTFHDQNLKTYFENYLNAEYPKSEDERLHYNGFGQISRYIEDEFKRGQTGLFDPFFEAVELILSSCDREIANLVVIGLFEAIQNIGGNEINYYSGFNKWLRTISKLNWDQLIDFWEGKGWRDTWQSIATKNTK